MNVGVLASHEGTTLQSLMDGFSGGRIQGRVAVVVSNNGDSGALRRARRAGVQAVHLSSKTHEDPAALDAAIRGVLAAASVGVVFLAGYMKKLGRLVLRAFEGRILNTHPALLPRFGGPGMYGDRVSRFIWSMLTTTPAPSCVSAGCRCFGAIPSTISRPEYGHERRNSWSKRLG